MLTVQALPFYESFHGMTPDRATDKLIWAWMTHFRLHSYTLKRWRRQENTNITEYIRAHWFVDNQGTALWNSNTASRTWWIAHTAIKAAQASGGAFTARSALGHFADLRCPLPHTDSFYDPALTGRPSRVCASTTQ